MTKAMTSLTTAAKTTESTRVSTGKTVFLTMAALSVRAVEAREMPSWIAIQGSSPARRNSGKVENPFSTGIFRMTPKTHAYRRIHSKGWAKAQKIPSREPAYLARISLSTISLTRKRRAERLFLLLDIGRRDYSFQSL